MYWTHLIFALVLGLLFYDRSITAVKPGYLDFDNLPETNFSCKNKVIGGYYADVETGCQMFHVCTIGQKGEVTDIKFLCLNGTVFDQETRVCERIDEVDCSKSEDFFNLNLELYGNQAGIQPEEEFFCEDCSTEEDDYDLSEDVTTRPTSTTTSRSTTTTTTTSTTAAPATLPPATPKIVQHYPTSNPETIAALLALHNAFTQSVQNPKVKAPPPRVINHAFASLTPSTPKPSYYGRPKVTQLPPRQDSSFDDDDEESRNEHEIELRVRQHDFNVRQQDQHVRQQDANVRQQDANVRQQDANVRQQDANVRQQDANVRQQDFRIQGQSDHRYAPHGHGTLTSAVKERHKTNFYQLTTQPPSLKSNYHHFQSGDSGFVHSFDTGKQYNYQYFHPRKLPETTAKASVSIVTSTSTSTSVRASRPNETSSDDVTGPAEDFPTGYDDYPDDSVDEAFFRDVPKIRNKRKAVPPEPRHANHRYPDDVVTLPTTTERHRNHRYDWTPSRSHFLPTVPGASSVTVGILPVTAGYHPSTLGTVSTPGGILSDEEVPSHREEFLQNLLGSLDMEEHDRQKMARFFKIEERGMDESAGLLHQLGNKLGELIMDDINKTIHQAQIEETNSTSETLDLETINEMWKHHYEEMSQEVDLNFDLATERGRRDADKKEKLAEELAQDYELAKDKPGSAILTTHNPQPQESADKANGDDTSGKSRIKRQVKGIDTEKFGANYEPRKRGKARPVPPATTRTSLVSVKDAVPVFEEVDEGDFTTRPYLRTSDRTQRPRLTTRSADSSVSRPRFNYEITTPVSSSTLRRRPQGGRLSRVEGDHQRLPEYRSVVPVENQSLLDQKRASAPPGSLYLVPNVTRDVSKLKDTPVYEEENDSGEVANVRIPLRQEIPESAQRAELSNGQLVTKLYLLTTPIPPHFSTPDVSLQSDQLLEEPRESASLEALPELTTESSLPPSTRKQSHRKRIPVRSRFVQRAATSDVSQRIADPETPPQSRRSQTRHRLRNQQSEAVSLNGRVSEARGSVRDPEAASSRDPEERAEVPAHQRAVSKRVRVNQAEQLRRATAEQTEFLERARVSHEKVLARAQEAQLDLLTRVNQGEVPTSYEAHSEVPVKVEVEPAEVSAVAQAEPVDVPRRVQAEPVELPRRIQAEPEELPRRVQTQKASAGISSRTRADIVSGRPRGNPAQPPKRVWGESGDTPSRVRVNSAPKKSWEEPTEAAHRARAEQPQRPRVVSRGKARGTLRSTTPPNEPPPAPPVDPNLAPDPNFSCDGKIKGGFYADVSNACKGFFICSQGQIDGPLLKSHFWCGTSTKFNQRSRTCQAEDLVECSVSERYYHLNQDFAIPETEEQLKPAFEPKRVQE